MFVQSKQLSDGARASWFSSLSVAVAAALWCSASASQVQAEDHVWKVEEHWELVIAEPDPEVAGPQVTCAISPRSHLAGLYATFDLNHRALPTIAAGGVHLHTWNGESLGGTISRHSDVVLSKVGETITWKTVMSVQPGLLTIDIDDGTSTTWGAFGQGLIASMVASLTNLDEYSPVVSADNSGISYASNRVNSLQLKKVKYYRVSGATSEDNTVRIIHSVE